MSENAIITKFKKNYPNFVGSSNENPSDPTILLLKMLAESESIGENYYNYYMSEEYNLTSHMASKLFNYNLNLNVPYRYDLKASVKIKESGNKPVKLQLPQYTSFKSKNSNYILENSLIVNNYSSTESLILIQGELKSETINSLTIINTSRIYKLTTSDKIYADIGYLEIDGIRYTDYSIINAKYSDTEICYGVELSEDGNYYLIISKKLLDKIMNNSIITLNFIVKDTENDGETITELTTDPITLNEIQYEISIDQITINTKMRDQLISTTLLDFDTNISKFDYEENANSLESVILAKAYDCEDIISKSIIELNPDNPETWDVKLTFPKDSDGNLIPVPYYMYIVVASENLYTESIMSIQLKKEIMNSLQNGLSIKEVLLDYGTESRTIGDTSYNVSIRDQGYQLSSTYRPYQLPFIIDSRNSLEPITNSDILNDKTSRYNMPDLVIQLEPASYVPIDMVIKLDLSYDTLDDLMNFYLSLIDSIKSLFELSKSNDYLKFNSKIVKSDIDKIIYQYSGVNYAIIEDFEYYRNNKKLGPVKEIQLAPFELPVLGKLTIQLYFKFKSLSDMLNISDENLN